MLFGMILMLILKLKLSFGAKNVLFIVVDDLRPSLGEYGDRDSYTPNIDRLINEGITFDKAFAQQALCAPSRNSFLTSRRPDTLHLYDFYNYWRGFTGNFTTLPQYFKENSYETKSIGKIFHPGQSSNFTDDYPLSWSLPPWHPPSEKFKDAPVCLSKDEWVANIVCPVRLEEQPGKTLPDIESTTEAINFLMGRDENSKPFFLAVGLHKPHIPLKFPEQFLEYHPLDNVSLPDYRHYPPGLPEVAWNPWTDLRSRHDISQLNLTFPFQEIPDNWVKLIRQSYYASITYVDSLLGKILNSLKIKSLHESTLVVFMGDHGWSLGEHGEWSKYSNFDVALRVPLIFRIPQFSSSAGGTNKIDSVLKESVRISEIVELVDIFPTIVDLTGLPKIPKCPRNSANIKLCTEGESLLPLVLRKSNKFGRKTVRWKNQALSQYPRPGLIPSLHPNSDKPRLHEIKIMGYSIRTERYRYTEWIGWNSTIFEGNWSNVYGIELYDHHIDDRENLNIANRPDMGCATDVFDGVSYGTVTGFIIGAFVGAIHAKIVKAPYIKPYVMSGGINNALFGATFFGFLMAYRSCFR